MYAWDNTAMIMNKLVKIGTKLARVNLFFSYNNPINTQEIATKKIDGKIILEVITS